MAKTFAYCLLPNHFHFAIQTLTEDEQEMNLWRQTCSQSRLIQSKKSKPTFVPKPPSRAFNNLFIAYSRAFNKTNKRTGVLFETPFGRKIVDNEAYLLTLITYINQNPQMHGLVSDFRQWKWSSFGALISDRPTKIERDLVLAWFGGREAFLEMRDTAVDQDVIASLIDIPFESR